VIGLQYAHPHPFPKTYGLFHLNGEPLRARADGGTGPKIQESYLCSATHSASQTEYGNEPSVDIYSRDLNMWICRDIKNERGQITDR
jgi:hypothetical protein